MLIFDPIEARDRYSASWNFDPKWMERYNEAYAADDPTRDSFLRFDVGEPFNIPMLLDRKRWLETRYYKEYCQPKGWLDSLGVTVMKSPSRLVSLAVVRHEDVGFAGPRELEILRLLAPHLRNTVSIADLIEMQRLTAQTFDASFDTLRARSSTPTAPRARRLPVATPFAWRMACSGRAPPTPPSSCGPRWPRWRKAKTTTMHRSSSFHGPMARRPLRRCCRSGFGGVRGRIEPRAIAAVFVTQAGGPNVVPFQVWASAFGLIAAEVRVLELLVEGGNIVEVAGKLNVAAATARTHLARLMRKTGSARQTDLVRLALQLAAPLRAASLKKS